MGECQEFYAQCVASVARYCEKYHIEHRVQTEPKLKIAPRDSKRSTNAMRLGYLPIFEKANAFDYLGDNNVCVIDADVFIRDGAPNIFDECTADFSGVLERDLPLTDKHSEVVKKYSEGQYRLLDDVDWKWNKGAAFYNMGVMLMDSRILLHMNDETPYEFIHRPEFARFVNGEGHWRWSTDQTLLNYWVKKSGMTTNNLSWKWNCLYGAVRPECVREAHFVHFFLSAKMPRGGAEIPDIIKTL